MRKAILLPFLLSAACGPSDRTSPSTSIDGGGDGSGGEEQPATIAISGTVWAPGNAPGQVPSGHEIPVFDAVVYLSSQRPEPIPQQTYCEPCTPRPGNAVSTDHKGHFVLTGVRPGDSGWLVIQKGQFRLEQQVTLEESSVLPATMTTLPSQSDPAGGKFIPRIALASGGSDQMESIFGKLGIGEVDGSGKFVRTSAAGSFDVYSNGGQLDTVALGTLASLVSDLDKMLQYHIIFVPCSTASPTGLSDIQNLRNIREYVKAGGRLYVADWSGEWMDMPFPRQVELYGSGIDTPGDAYDPTTDTWNTSMMGSSNGSLYTSNNAEVTDPDMFQWLDGQAGPNGLYDASSFQTKANWNIINKLHSVQVGVDGMGAPVMDVPRTYVVGDNPNMTAKQPQTVTFEPAGCGRVLYTTYHSVPEVHVGLVPQERILAYLLMEIGVCKEGPVVE
jgi:hypothetical protein